MSPRKTLPDPEPPSGDPPPSPVRLRDRILEQEALFDEWDRSRESGRVPHATLLLGPRGCGKGRVALAMAQDLLCEGADPPCGTCSACREVARMTHPDLHVLLPAAREDQEDQEEMAKRMAAYAADPRGVWDAPGNATIGIDQARRLKEEASKAGVRGDRRVLLILGADRMTEQAAQSTLKLVEEPPAEALLLLTAEDPARLLPTLVSRCRRMRLRPLRFSTLLSILTGELAVPETDARLLCALSGGSLGQALAMRASDLLTFRDSVLRIFSVDDRVDLLEVERRVAFLESEDPGGAVRQAGMLMLIWYHDLLNARAGLPAERLANSDKAEEARRAGSALGLEEIERRLAIVEEMSRAVEQNVNPALALHVALSRIACLGGES